MAPSFENLHLVAARRATFHKNRKGQATKLLNWPHPLTAAEAKRSTIHPDHLALAGFYSTPMDDDPTVTTCFQCECVVGMWEEGESPVERHLAVCDEERVECPWAVIQHASWESLGFLAAKSRDEWEECWGKDGVLHPRGPLLERARRGTFEHGWPHQGKKGMPTPDDVS